MWYGENYIITDILLESIGMSGNLVVFVVEITYVHTALSLYPKIHVVIIARIANMT